MWPGKKLDKTAGFLNLKNSYLGDFPFLIEYSIYLFMDEYKRRAHRRTPISWTGKRFNKVYSFKIAKTTEVFKRRSVLKPKGVHKFKKYLNYKFKIINSFFRVDSLNESEFFKKKKLNINDELFLTESFYMILESEAPDYINNPVDDGSNFLELYDKDNANAFCDEYFITNFEEDIQNDGSDFDTFEAADYLIII